MKILSDETITKRKYLKAANNNAALLGQIVSDLSIPVAANQILAFEFVLNIGYSGSGGANGCKFTVAGPLLSNIVAQLFGNANSDTTFTHQSIVPGLLGATIHSYSSANGICAISGIIINGSNAGTIDLYHAPSVAILGTSTVNIGSFSRADNVL